MPSIDPNDVRSAINRRDQRWLSELITADFATTLYVLDAEMRGIHRQSAPWQWHEEPPEVATQVLWMREQDRALREQLDRSQRRDADLSVLRAAYHAGDLALAVGAGVSQGAGMPGWKDLVAEVLEHALNWRERLKERARGGLLVIGDMAYLGDSPSQAEAHIDAVAPPLSADRQSLLETLRDKLRPKDAVYSDSTLVEATQVTHDVFGKDFLQEVRVILYSRPVYRTKTHVAIASMVRPPGPGTVRPGCRNIITYNFDDLIEVAIWEAGLGYTVSCSQDGNMMSHRGQTAGRPSAVNVLHVHGIAPNSFLAPLDIDLVFSASQYDQQYGSSHLFTPAAQRAFYLNAPTLFIGFSFTDAKAKDLLSDAHADRPGWFHYCVKQLPSEHRAVGDQLRAATLNELERPYRNIGVKVIWISGFEEIPDVLDQIQVPPPNDPFHNAETAYRSEDATAEAEAYAAIIQSYRFPRAIFNLAQLREQQGNATCAAAGYRDCLTSGHREWAPKAALNLGLLLEKIKDLDGALKAYSAGSVIDSPWATAPSYRRGELFEELGQRDLALQAYHETALLAQHATKSYQALLAERGMVEDDVLQEYEEVARFHTFAGRSILRLQVGR